MILLLVRKSKFALIGINICREIGFANIICTWYMSGIWQVTNGKLIHNTNLIMRLHSWLQA